MYVNVNNVWVSVVFAAALSMNAFIRRLARMSGLLPLNISNSLYQSFIIDEDEHWLSDIAIYDFRTHFLLPQVKFNNFES